MGVRILRLACWLAVSSGGWVAAQETPGTVPGPSSSQPDPEPAQAPTPAPTASSVPAPPQPFLQLDESERAGHGLVMFVG